MGSLLHPVSLRIPPNSLLLSHRPLRPPSVPKITRLPPSSSRLNWIRSLSAEPRRASVSTAGVGPTEEEESPLESLKVPDSWLAPSKALQESEWLRIALHKWLDDEYCPEPANVEISKVAASSYYESLMAKKTDLGDILLEIIGGLQTVSFQESFHGVFSSANAAVHLITLRIDSLEGQ